nr:MAG TPA: hypothetical protein [Bacteriophage sp.]
MVSQFVILQFFICNSYDLILISSAYIFTRSGCRILLGSLYLFRTYALQY